MLTLRDYQREAVDAILHYLQTTDRNGVVAMPTGTGKSVVIAGFIAEAQRMFPNKRFLVLTHVKELVEQNAKKLKDYWKEADIGVYSAGLRKKQTAHSILFGGCASVINAMEDIGAFDLVFVDECHLISPKEGTVYQRIVGELKEKNSALRVVGLSATPYRMRSGLIVDGTFFHDMIIDMTGVNRFNQFIRDGVLAPLIPKKTKIERQSNVETKGANGDYSAAALEADAADKEVTYKALCELHQEGAERNSWLVFASTIEDADWIAETLQSFGIAAASVHSKIKASERDNRIRAFKSGELRCIVNMGVLTTGFDHPPLDLIAVLRRTVSPGLWVQMLGRGTRPCDGKDNCLVLDFAGNTRRLGPINDPKIPGKRKKKKTAGDIPIKICGECGTYNHLSARECIMCCTVFPTAVVIAEEASTEVLIKEDEPVLETKDVVQVHYYLHEKVGSIPSIRVSYHCSDKRRYDEWVCIQHPEKSYASIKAKKWWRERFPIYAPVPTTTKEALTQITDLLVPKQIVVVMNKKYPEIKKCIF